MPLPTTTPTLAPGAAERHPGPGPAGPLAGRDDPGGYRPADRGSAWRSAIAAGALLAECSENVARDRGTTVELLIRLGAIDERQLYLPLACASMYAYCTQVMRMSENAAFQRIRAAQRAGFAKRYIPRAVARAVWPRDGGQCTFTAEAGERESATAGGGKAAGWAVRTASRVSTP